MAHGQKVCRAAVPMADAQRVKISRGEGHIMGMCRKAAMGQAKRLLQYFLIIINFLYMFDWHTGPEYRVSLVDGHRTTRPNPRCLLPVPVPSAHRRHRAVGKNLQFAGRAL